MADHSREDFGYGVLWLGIHWQAVEIQPSNTLLARNVSPAVPAALADTRAVLQHGARQTGRSPLARSLAIARRAGAPSRDRSRRIPIRPPLGRFGNISAEPRDNLGECSSNPQNPS